MAEHIDDAWGAPERYYTAHEYRARPRAVSKSWEESLNRVAPGCDEAVRRGVDLSNLRVRTQQGVHENGSTPLRRAGTLQHWSSDRAGTRP